MKKKTVLFLVLMLLLLALLTNGLQGQEKEEIGTTQISCFLKGNDYLELTKQSRLFYVFGLVDMLWSQTNYFNPKLYSDIDEATNNMNGEQIMAIFDKYLEEHPEKWHYTAAYLFRAAIMEIVGDN